MYIAAGKFTALKIPSNELDKKHWVEFKAPEGKHGLPLVYQVRMVKMVQTVKMVKMVVMDMMVLD